MSFYRVLAASAALALAACGGGEPDDDAEAPTSAEATGDAFTPWDAAREGVETTASGLQYVVLERGPEDADAPTSARDTVTVMYEGRIADTGEIFDSSYERGAPASFPLNRVIPGWTEGLQLMGVGDEFVFFIPSALGYGDSPRPGGVIQPGDDLVFKVELLNVDHAPPPRAADDEAWSAYTPWNSELDGVEATGSGLEYVVLESGPDDGAPPAPTDPVVLHYEGRFNETGETFDSSFPSGQAAVFPQAGGLIPGFSEALGLMRPGDHWLIYIPSDLAYGADGAGPIPPDSDLVFELELQDVLRQPEPDASVDGEAAE